MKATQIRQVVAILLCAAGSAACAGATAAGVERAPDPQSGSTDELEAIYRARIENARMRFTEADVRFMNGMIAHHAQAIQMARLAPTRASSASVRTLAARIINAQQDEIATMQRWLADRRQPVPEIHVESEMVMVHGADHAEHMPGMISPEQLRQLEQARGTDFERLFLTLMIQHHRGAVVMVEELFRTDGAGQDEEVFKFASDVQVDQATEIARMEKMLSALPKARTP